MQWRSFVALAFAAQNVDALLRFSCSQLTVDRIDPLVNPGSLPSPHLHQIVGGNSFNATMDPTIDIGQQSTCTTCTFSEDFSNYWTAVMYFRAQNGSFHRVPQMGNVGFESANQGGVTVYYSPSTQSGVKTTAFKQGFRMLIGDQTYRTKDEASKFRQLTYTCLQNANTRTGETMDFPTKPCPAGIMANLRFPTCWDGKNLDSPDHMSHVAYPSSGTFESNGPCPSTHPVHIPQVFYEVVWDTRKLNDKSLWPTDGSQPFVWSFGDATGYGTHEAMDANCNINCPQLKTQTIAQGNKCTLPQSFKEPIDGWLTALPGNEPVTSTSP